MSPRQLNTAISTFHLMSFDSFQARETSSHIVNSPLLLLPSKKKKKKRSHSRHKANLFKEFVLVSLMVQTCNLNPRRRTPEVSPPLTHIRVLLFQWAGPLTRSVRCCLSCRFLRRSSPLPPGDVEIFLRRPPACGRPARREYKELPGTPLRHSSEPQQPLVPPELNRSRDSSSRQTSHRRSG